jgi:hypothetical protein
MSESGGAARELSMWELLGAQRRRGAFASSPACCCGLPGSSRPPTGAGWPSSSRPPWVVLHGGEVAECGTHDELMAAGGRYAELFTLQAQAYLPGER